MILYYRPSNYSSALYSPNSFGTSTNEWWYYSVFFDKKILILKYE